MHCLNKRLRNSLGVHVGFWLYLIGGSAIYFLIENPAHTPQDFKQVKINASFCQLLVEKVSATTSRNAAYVTLHSDLLEEVERACYSLTGITESTSEADESGTAWGFSSALFFTMTILTTIGYGSFAPLTDGGKIFCITYGLFGIPFCGLFLAKTSDYFSSALLRLYESRQKKDDKWSGIFVAAAVFLLPGLGLFLFIPAAIFTYIEGWTYLDAIYFSFITLTTVGLGDIVATQRPSSYWLLFYRISWIVWVYLGIAYWAIIITFVTKALKSKELKKRLILFSQQAQNMGKPSDAFVAARTKAAMGFALQMTGAMGNFGSEVQPCLSPLPGIASALKPLQGPGRGVVSLLMLAKQSGESTEHNRFVSYTASSIDKQAESGRAISNESGLESVVLSDFSLAENSHVRVRRGSLRQAGFPKTDSCLSLPAKLDSDNHLIQNKQKLGNRIMC